MSRLSRFSLFALCVTLWAVCLGAQELPRNPAGTSIRKWRVCGPFDARGVLAAVVDGEDAMDPAASVAAVRGIPWKELRAEADIVDLEAAGAFGPRDFSVGFAFAEIESDGEGDVILGLGSDDAAIAWWNGRQVLVQDVLRGTIPGEDQVVLRMKKGRNTLLLKIYDEGGGWSFAADLRPATTNAWAWRDTLPMTEEEFLDLVQKTSFDFYWKAADPETGLVPDGAPARDVPNRSPCSVAAVGFGLTAICVADSRGWVERDAARERVARTLKFLLDHVEGERGFFYHFVDMKTGKRAWNSELSSIDTALCLAGALTCRGYFNDPEIAALADALYARVDWAWMMNGGDTLSMGWKPESGFLGARWDSYCEHMILYLLAIGSPTHPIPAASWHAWRRDVFTYNGMTYIQGTPLFLHQYSHIWVDFRDRRDAYADYFRNSALATIAHRDFCVGLQKRFPHYSENLWGVTASKGAKGYMVWGGPPEVKKYPMDGTVVPCSAGGSVAFVPDLTIPVLREIYEKHRGKAWGRFGFYDAFNPATGWSAYSYLGIDVGPTMLMIENHRTGNVWKWFMDCAAIQDAMHKTGFKRTGWGLENADIAYLRKLAKETWDCIAQFVNPETGLPYDSSLKQEFTSVSNIGLYLAALAAARDMGFVSEAEALARAGKVVGSIERFPVWRGFCQCWHSVKDLAPSPHDTWVSAVDSGNFAMGLTVAARAFPELTDRLIRLRDAMDWTALYDPRTRQFFGGYDMKNKAINPDWRIDMLGTDSRAAAFMAVASGRVEPVAWTSMTRRVEERYHVKYLAPGWVGGGLFMQYLTGIFLDERQSVAGRSAANFAYANMRHADEQGLAAWGWSSCADPDGGYIGWGKLRDDVVTPHASVLAIEDFPEEVVRNLYELQRLGARPPWVEGGRPHAFGFRDSIRLTDRKVSAEYLVLDQGMLFLSLANFLEDGLVRRYFHEDEAVRAAVAAIPELAEPEGGARVSVYEPGLGVIEESAREAKRLDVTRVKKAPVLDGDLSDWPSGGSVSLRYPEDGEIGIPLSGTNFGATFRFAWDDSALYVGATVEDDELLCSRPAQKIYEDDVLELFFDPKDDGFIWGNGADVQMGFSPSGPSRKPQVYAWFQNKVPAGVEVAARVDERGPRARYVLEARVPWGALGLEKMEAGREMPASFAVHTVNKARDASAKINWSYREDAEGIRLGRFRFVE